MAKNTPIIKINKPITRVVPKCQHTELKLVSDRRNYADSDMKCTYKCLKCGMDIIK